MRKKNILFIILTIFILTISSCEENKTTSSLILNLDQEKVSRDKSILPEDIPLEVTQYTITGNGPFEKDSFTVNTRDNKTTIKGLTIGDWDLFAVGKNSDGLLLISGSASVEVGNKPSEVVIELDKLVGNGNISVDFIWNPELTTNPKLELELTSQNNTSLNVTPTTIDYSQGVATFETVARSDSYTLNAKLYDSDVLLSGCIEAIRVVMNKTSKGTIHFNLNEDSNSSSDIPIIINNNLGVPITCHINDVPQVVSFNQEIYPILVEENNLPLNAFSIDWYLDGALIGSGENCNFKPSIGFHRLDVIVENGDIGSTSSAFREFEVKVNAPAYLPKVVSTINNGDNGFYAGSNMHICFLPDNKIISYCGETHTLQICRLINNSLEVIKTYNNSYDMPLSNVIDMKVDETRNRVYISELSTNSISIYDYSYNKLTKYFSDDTYHQYANHFGQIFIRPKDFLVFDHLGDSYREYKIDPALDNKFIALNMVKDPDDINYHCTKGLMSPNLDAVAFASDTGYVSLAYNLPGYSDCLLRATSGLKYNPNEILVAGALDWKTFIAGANNRIIIGSLSGDNLQYSSTLAETKTYVSNTYGLPEFSDVNNFIYYMGYDNLQNLATLEKIFALCKGSNALLAFDVDPISFDLTYLGKENLVDFSPNNGVLSKDKSLLIVTGENEKCIKICQIHE